MLKITLWFPTNTPGEQFLEEQDFTQGFISGRAFRKTMEMKKKVAGGVDETVLDEMVDYVVYLFANQFTRDQFYDGIAAEKMMDTIVGCINKVVGGASKAIGANGEQSPN